MEKKNKQLLLVIVVAIIIFIIIILAKHWYGEKVFEEVSGIVNPPFMDVLGNISAKTLTVIDVYGNLSWDEIIILKGSADLPEGYVEIGDVITNCNGCIEIKVKDRPGVIGTPCFE